MSDGGNRVRLVTLYTRVLLQLIDNPRISQEMLARRLDVTMRTAQRHLSELEEEGYITVDREKKPFEYSIDWGKTWPYVPWLRVIVYHPELRDAFQGLSDAAYRTYELAAAGGEDTSAALHTAFSQPETGKGVA